MPRLTLPVNDTGKVKVFLPGGDVEYLHPVDAREQLGRGIVSLEPMPKRKAKAAAGTEMEPEDSGGFVPSANLDSMTVKELAAYVESVGLDVDLSKHRLKEDKVAAVKSALNERREAEIAAGLSDADTTGAEDDQDEEDEESE